MPTQIKSPQIADSAIIATKIATDAVETAKIKDANVTTAKLANNSVTVDKSAIKFISGTNVGSPNASGLFNVTVSGITTILIASAHNGDFNNYASQLTTAYSWTGNVLTLMNRNSTNGGAISSNIRMNWCVVGY